MLSIYKNQAIKILMVNFIESKRNNMSSNIINIYHNDNKPLPNQMLYSIYNQLNNFDGDFLISREIYQYRLKY